MNGDTEVAGRELHFLPPENFSAKGRKILAERYPFGAVIEVETGAFWPADEDEYGAYERGRIPGANPYFERELVKDLSYEKVMREGRRLMERDFTGEMVVGFKNGVASVRRVRRRGARAA